MFSKRSIAGALAGVFMLPAALFAQPGGGRRYHGAFGTAQDDTSGAVDGTHMVLGRIGGHRQSTLSGLVAKARNVSHFA